MSQILTNPGWSTKILVVEDCLVVLDVRATWFGGPDDPLDGGQTSSGKSTLEPGVLGCALPIPVKVRGKEFEPTSGSPWPRNIPWGTLVTVVNKENGRSVTVPLIDRGPAREAVNEGNDQIDLTPATFEALGVPLKSGKYQPLEGRLEVDFCVHFNLDEHDRF